MNKINEIISENLKKLRELRNLSLDKVSKMTGVSKSMLGQIERGEVNPTISTLWKISYGLKISFTQLMSRPEREVEFMEKNSIAPITADDGKFRAYTIFPFDDKRRFETYSIEVDSGGKVSAEPHPQGTQEFITVYSGEITVAVDEKEYMLYSGNSMRFKADRTHSYRNCGSDICTMSMVIYYPEYE